MNKRYLMFLLLLTLSIVGVLALRLISPEDTWTCQNNTWVKHGNPSSPAPASGCGQPTLSPATPSDVVRSFYDWYLSYNGNPLSDRTFQTSPQLSSELKKEVTEFVNNGPGFDPFLCAQDKPTTLETGNARVNGDTSTLMITKKYSNQTVQTPITLYKTDGRWYITKIDCSYSSPAGSTQPTETVIVYYSNSLRAKGDNDCSLVYGVQRSVNPGTLVYESALRQLFKGPNNAEKSQGYSSFFSEKTKDILRSIKIVDTTAFVDLSDIRTIIPNASTSCGSAQLLSSIEETLKHDRKIKTVRFAINGNPQTFYNWLQIGCDGKTNNCDAKPFSN